MIIHFKERGKTIHNTNIQRRKKKIQRRLIKIDRERVIGIEFTKIEVTKGQVLEETTEISIKMINGLENVTRKKITGRSLVEIKMRNLKTEMTNIEIEIRVKIVKKLR